MRNKIRLQPIAGKCLIKIKVKTPTRAFVCRVLLEDWKIHSWPVYIELEKALQIPGILDCYDQFSKDDLGLLCCAFVRITRHPPCLKSEPDVAALFLRACEAGLDSTLTILARLRKANLRSGDAKWRAVQVLREHQTWLINNRYGWPDRMERVNLLMRKGQKSKAREFITKNPALDPIKNEDAELADLAVTSVANIRAARRFLAKADWENRDLWAKIRQRAK